MAAIPDGISLTEEGILELFNLSSKIDFTKELNELVEPLMEPSQIINGDTTYNSFYASAFVVDENKLRAEVEQRVRTSPQVQL